MKPHSKNGEAADADEVNAMLAEAEPEECDPYAYLPDAPRFTHDREEPKPSIYRQFMDGVDELGDRARREIPLDDVLVDTGPRLHNGLPHVTATYAGVQYQDVLDTRNRDAVWLFVEQLAERLDRPASEMPEGLVEKIMRAVPDDFYKPPSGENEPEPEPLLPVSIGQMVKAYKNMEEPLVDGLLRRRETLNIIAAPKVGKSWLAYLLALCVALGLEWLGRFPCRQGKVLYIDNELHPSTLAHRMPAVARALGLEPHEYQDEIDVLSLRGQLRDLHGIAYAVERLQAGKYELCILDAFYRALPADVSENDNGQITRLFNTLDAVTDSRGMAWVNIHHQSKGSQQDKIVSDVGAGAGAQSRAADCHLVLRPHEEQGVYVLEGIVRSFAPIEALAVKWEYPLWLPVDADPALVKGRKAKATADHLEADRKAIVGAMVRLKKAGTKTTLRGRANITSSHRFNAALESLLEDGTASEFTTLGNNRHQYTAYGLKEWENPSGTSGDERGIPAVPVGETSERGNAT